MISSYYKFVLFFGFWLGCLTIGHAQITAADTAQSSDLVDLPPLDVILTWAREYSPSVAAQGAIVDRNKFNVKSQKHAWITGFGPEVQLSSSNQALIVQQPTGELQAFDNYNNGYRAALTLQLSIYDVLNRKNLVGMAKKDLETAIQQKEIVAQELSSRVVSYYYAIQAAQRILVIKGQGRQMNILSKQAAEKDFSQGIIPITELARITDLYTRAAEEYEVARQSLFQNIRTLELYIGRKISTKP